MLRYISRQNPRSFHLIEIRLQKLLFSCRDNLEILTILTIFYCLISSANFTKWSNTLKQFLDKLATNCLSVFDHFVGLALKGLISFISNLLIAYILLYSVMRNFTSKTIVQSRLTLKYQKINHISHLFLACLLLTLSMHLLAGLS